MPEDNRSEPTDSSDPEDTQSKGSGMTRRQMVTAGAATWASVSLAGCNYLTGPGDDGLTETPSDDDQPNTTVTANTTTTGDTGSGDDSTAATTTACSQSAKFLPGMEVGILTDVFNSADGSYAGADVVESVVVSFPDADIEPKELTWTGAHETDSEKSWGAAVQTAADAATGTYQYEITVEPKPDADLDKTTITDSFEIV